MVTLRYQHASISVTNNHFWPNWFFIFYLLLMLIADFISLDSNKQKRIAHLNSSRIITHDLGDNKIERFELQSNVSFEFLNLVFFKLC